jgi:NAD(P)-dependent dehydrogenase (short-subunit alcohol dehydrogenase family)
MSSIVVTGASSGIGRATALLLAAHGHQVFGTVRKNADAQALAGRRQITPVLLDVTEAGQLADAVAAIEAQVSAAGLDGLVNNAGSGAALPLELTSRAELRRQLEVNTIGQLAVTQAFLPLLRRARGRIVMIGSIGVRCPPPFSGPIVIPKAALTAVTHALRQELSGCGIRTILVDPATIRTDAGDKVAADAAATLAAFTDSERVRYGAAVSKMTSAFTRSHRQGSPPEKVAAVIVRALTSRRPQAHYTVGKNSRRMTLISRLPIPLADAVRRRIFGMPAPGSICLEGLPPAATTVPDAAPGRPWNSS